MADNTTINVGSGGDVIATDDIAGVKHQLVKVEYGAADSATQVSATNPLPVSEPRPSTPTLAQVASSATSVTLQAANTNRLSWICVNDSTQVLYVKFGTTASATSYTYRLVPGAILELEEPCYDGRIDGIWAAANGNAYVTELTA